MAFAFSVNISKTKHISAQIQRYLLKIYEWNFIFRIEYMHDEIYKRRGRWEFKLKNFKLNNFIIEAVSQKMKK